MILTIIVDNSTDFCSFLFQKRCTPEKSQNEELRSKLNDCMKRNADLLHQSVLNEVNDSLKSDLTETPYLKQIYRLILGIAKQMDVSSVRRVTFEFRNKSLAALESCLNSSQRDVQDCADSLLGIFKTGTVDKTNHIVAHVFNLLEKINLAYVSYICLALIIVVLVFYFTVELISLRHSIFGTIVLFGGICFLVSVPSEWMRMYKTSLAKKTYDRISTTKECFQEEMTYLSMLKFWLRDSFTFADDPCLKYHDSVIVDPIWEISPGQVC